MSPMQLSSDGRGAMAIRTIDTQSSDVIDGGHHAIGGAGPSARRNERAQKAYTAYSFPDPWRSHALSLVIMLAA